MDTYSDGVKEGARVALHFQGEVLAVMEVSSKWVPDKAKEAMQSYRSVLQSHHSIRLGCGVSTLVGNRNDVVLLDPDSSFLLITLFIVSLRIFPD